MRGLGGVWLAAGIYAAVYVALDLDRYVTYHSGADLGLFTQTIASAFHGFSNTVEGGSHFTFHFSPILYAFAPVLWVTRSPAALLVLQACAAALAAPPLFLIARRRTGERLAFLIAAVTFVYPPLAGVAFSDFHENGFAPAATLWLFWAVDARRWRAAAAFLAVSLAIKEDQAVILTFGGALAAVYCLRRNDAVAARFVAAGALASAAVFATYFAIVRPLAGAAHWWEPLHFYATAAAEPVARHPVVERLTYLLEAFAPLCFTCFWSPALLLAVPGFLELFLSRDPVMYTMGQHYAAVWIPYVLAAFALGLARIARVRPVLALRLAAASLVLCVLNLAFLSPTHWGHYLAMRTPHDAALDAAVRALPRDASVGTHDELYAHLGFDPNASLGLRDAPALALFDESNGSSYWVQRTAAMLRDRGGQYRAVRDVDGVVLYRREGSSDGRR
jgi:uncharacterized membrane protein